MDKRGSRVIEKREMVEVLFDYSGHGVSVKAGEMLPLLDASNHEWWKVEFKDGRGDYVPANHVRRTRGVSEKLKLSFEN